MRSATKYKKSKNPRKLAPKSQAGNAIGSTDEEISPALLRAASMKKKKMPRQSKQTSWQRNRHQDQAENI